jgi:hypothetical protein
MNNEPQLLIDEAYENYRIAFVEGYIHEELDKCLSQEEFIEEIKTDKDFSEKWGLTIEERELSLEERYDWFIKTYNTNLTRSSNQYNMEDILSSNNCPNKLITITYNDQTIESYE